MEAIRELLGSTEASNILALLAILVGVASGGYTGVRLAGLRSMRIELRRRMLEEVLPAIENALLEISRGCSLGLQPWWWDDESAWQTSRTEEERLTEACQEFGSRVTSAHITVDLLPRRDRASWRVLAQRLEPMREATDSWLLFQRGAGNDWRRRRSCSWSESSADEAEREMARRQKLHWELDRKTVVASVVDPYQEARQELETHLARALRPTLARRWKDRRYIWGLYRAGHWRV